MKIVFWGYKEGQSSATSSMIAVSCMTALKHKINTAVLPLQYKNEQLHRAFIPKSGNDVVQSLMDTGVDALLRDVKSGSATADTLTSCALSFLNQKLNLYIPTRSLNEGTFVNSMRDCVDSVMTSLDTVYDITFVDAVSGCSNVTARSIAQADLAIICLPQSYPVIDELFSSLNFSANKYFFLFGDGDVNSVCNTKNLSRAYKKYVSEKNSAIIPHNTNFGDDMNVGSVSKFFLKNLNCKPGDANYRFIKEVSNATEKILKLGNVKMR